MNKKQQLIEINKHRREQKLTPWLSLWSTQDQKDWAGSIDLEVSEDLQKAMLDMMAGATLVACSADLTMQDGKINIHALPNQLHGRAPDRKHKYDGGLDLYGNKDYVIKCGGASY